MKKDINAILKRRAEFLNHRTRQPYYFNGARPSHLPSLRLKANEHFTDITSIRSEDGHMLTKPLKSMLLFAVSMLTCTAQRFLTAKIHATNSLVPSDYLK